MSPQAVKWQGHLTFPSRYGVNVSKPDPLSYVSLGKVLKRIPGSPLLQSLGKMQHFDEREWCKNAAWVFFSKAWHDTNTHTTAPTKGFDIIENIPLISGGYLEKQIDDMDGAIPHIHAFF